MFNTNIVIFFPTFLECRKVLNISDFSSYFYFDTAVYKSIPIIITGAGKSNAAAHSALFFSEFKTKYPLLTGICGAYQNTGIKISDVVCIDYDYFADEANYNGNILTTIHEKGFIIAKDNRAEFQVDENFKKVSSNTVSLIPQFNSLSNIYMAKTNALVENMEGAAFGIAANKFGIKPYQIRAVSNYCGNIEKQQWDINNACVNLKKAVDLFIETHK